MQIFNKLILALAICNFSNSMELSQSSNNSPSKSVRFAEQHKVKHFIKSDSPTCKYEHALNAINLIDDFPAKLQEALENERINENMEITTFEGYKLSLAAYAAWKGKLQALQILINFGARINWCNNRGTDLLQFAINGNDLECVNVLIQNHVKLRSIHFKTRSQSMLALLLKYAFFCGQEQLYLGPSDYAPLIGVCQKGPIGCLTTLLDYGVNPDQMFGTKLPIEEAAAFGQARLVQHFLNINIDPNSQNKSTFDTPIMAAAKNGHYLIVDTLCDNGAHPYQMNKRYQTAGDYAQSCEDEYYKNCIITLLEETAELKNYGLCELCHAKKGVYVSFDNYNYCRNCVHEIFKVLVNKIFGVPLELSLDNVLNYALLFECKNIVQSLLNMGKTYSDCSICAEQMNSSNLIILKCGHFFHKQCFSDFFSDFGCPSCNTLKCNQIKI